MKWGILNQWSIDYEYLNIRHFYDVIFSLAASIDANHISNIVIGGINKDKLMITVSNNVLIFTLK